MEAGYILIKEKAIGRPDGQTSKSMSFLCFATNPDAVVLDEKDFTDYRWVTLDELHKLPHVGIEAEFIKVEKIYSSQRDPTPYFIDTDQVDFRKPSS